MLAFDEFDNTVCKVINDKSLTLHKLAIVLEHWAEVVPPVTRAKTVKLIKSPCIRVIWILHTAVPLAKRSSSVTSFFE